MDWRHETSEYWLAARREVITATELVKLIPSLKKWEKSKGKEVPSVVASLWESKQSGYGDVTVSTGAAARGHIMEPYAIKSFNAYSETQYYHWDDCIICNSGLGFSPDALDVPQEIPDEPRLNVVHGYLYDSDKHEHMLPTALVEVKSYGIENHTATMLTEKMDVKERLQIAAAMIVLPSIQEGTLLLYNPQAVHSMVTFTYSRKDLAEDIETLENVLAMWMACCRKMEMIPVTMKSIFTEDQIYEEYLEQQQQSALEL